MNIPARSELVEAIGSPCPYCGNPMVLPSAPPTRDHVGKTAKRGGHLVEQNKLVVCAPCNQDKGRPLTVGLVQAPPEGGRPSEGPRHQARLQAQCGVDGCSSSHRYGDRIADAELSARAAISKAEKTQP
jgi:hypothetical protein